MFDKQAPPVSSVFIYSLTALVITGILVLAGCDSDDTTEPEDQIARVAISPDSASIEVGERVDFSAVALTASGDTIPDDDLDLTWQSTDPAVFTVEDDGTATGQDPGTAFCTIVVTNRPFTGRDSAFIRVLF